MWQHDAQTPSGNASGGGSYDTRGSHGDQLPTSTPPAADKEVPTSGLQQQQQQGGADHPPKPGVRPGEERYFWGTFWNMLVDIAAVSGLVVLPFLPCIATDPASGWVVCRVGCAMKSWCTQQRHWACGVVQVAQGEEGRALRIIAVLAVLK
jgi:hypothetical protein